jgi:hypothetical protein
LSQEWLRSTTRATSPRERDDLFLSFLFSATTDMRLIATCDQFCVDWSRVVGSIQTEVLRLLWGGRRRG